MNSVEIRTNVPTLFISGSLDNNTPPFQADEVRRTFRSSTHLIVENAGHESMVVDSRVQQTIVDYLRGGDVSKDNDRAATAEVQQNT